MKDQNLNRRQFLKGAAAAGLLGMSGLACNGGEGEAGAETAGSAERDHSRVILARSDDIRAGETDLKAAKVKGLLDEAVRRLTDKASARAAWESLFSPREKVTVKVGCLPGARLSSRPEVTQAVVDGLLSAGVRAANIIVWDRTDREMVEAGFEIRDAQGVVKQFGTDHLPPRRRYMSRIETAGQVGSLISRILGQYSDAVVSLSVLKDHDLSGVSMAMKNFFGAIHNPNKYHDNHCDPYIAQLMTHRYICERLRLVVTDGTLAQAHGGPAYMPPYAWHWNGLIVAADPVAADATGTQVIEERRRELGLPTLTDAGRPPAYIRTAQRLGVGFAARDRIELIEI